MKRVGGLFEQVCEQSNLLHALWRAAQGKSDRQEVQEFVRNGRYNLNSIAKELASGSYRFQGYRVFRVRDTKSRTIHAPPFRDRVVHHAMIAVVGPILERGALNHSYACRHAMGQHAAIRQAHQWTRRHLWYGKMDIEKFYDSVDHEILKKALARRFSERRLLRLFDHLLESYCTASSRGIPIGALTSQYLGNFYLDAFDRRMKATGLVPRYLRYMDDTVIWSTQDRLTQIRGLAHEYLSDLHLQMKNGGEWNCCQRGVPFLGFVIYPDRMRVNRNGRKRLRRKLGSLRHGYTAGRIDELELQRRCTSLFAHVRHADDVGWRRAVLACSAREHALGEWDQ